MKNRRTHAHKQKPQTAQVCLRTAKDALRKNNQQSSFTIQNKEEEDPQREPAE
jgi:hypothetical protein